MGKVLVEIGWFDLIECPDRISDDIEAYASEFIKSQKYKINRINTVDRLGNSSRKKISIGCCYDTKDFVNWINSSQLMDGECKAQVIREDIEPTEFEFALPHIYF